MKTKQFTITLLVTLLGYTQIANAQDEKYANKFSLLAGLIQPVVLGGGNIEATFFTKKMSFDYSHGFLLNMAGSRGTLLGDALDQKLAYHLPYSTGAGIGYRFTEYFDVRFEGKIHRWKVYYDDLSQTKENLIQEYKTYTLGLGAYYRYQPFRKKENALKGITASVSVRWWPNVGSSLKDDKFTYYHKIDNKTYTLPVSNIGIAGSQFLFNISVGYTFNFKSKS